MAQRAPRISTSTSMSELSDERDRTSASIAERLFVDLLARDPDSALERAEALARSRPELARELRRLCGAWTTESVRAPASDAPQELSIPARLDRLRRAHPVDRPC